MSTISDKELIELYVKLIQNDHSLLVGYCPFHDDATPSFRVYVHDDAWRWKCYACGRFGDAIDFIKLMAAERAELARQRAAVNQDDDRYRYVGGILRNRFGNVVNWKRYFSIVEEWKHCCPPLSVEGLVLLAKDAFCQKDFERLAKAKLESVYAKVPELRSLETIY